MNFDQKIFHQKLLNPVMNINSKWLCLFVYGFINKICVLSTENYSITRPKNHSHKDSLFCVFDITRETLNDFAGWLNIGISSYNANLSFVAGDQLKSTTKTVCSWNPKFIICLNLSENRALALSGSAKQKVWQSSHGTPKEHTDSSCLLKRIQSPCFPSCSDRGFKNHQYPGFQNCQDPRCPARLPRPPQDHRPEAVKRAQCQDCRAL